MANLYQVFAAALLCLGTFSSAQNVCPPEEILSPCTCLEATKTIQCSNISGEFNIKQIFDDISLLIDDQVIFDKLIVSSTSLIEFPCKAIEHVKFLEIEIKSNPNLEYFFKDSFVASLDVTKVLKLNSNRITNSGTQVRDIYDFVNQFVHLETLDLESNALTSVPLNALDALVDLKTLSMSNKNVTEIPSGALNLPSLISLDMYASGLTAIPDYGFGILPSLEILNLAYSPISSIGKEAFASSPNLNRTGLAYTALGQGNFHPLAFKGLGRGVRMNLEYNNFDHLREEVFKPLLDTAEAVYVGGNYCDHEGCYSRYFFCDERIHWICENAAYYETMLSGYRCATIGGFVWEYCANLTK